MTSSTWFSRLLLPLLTFCVLDNVVAQPVAVQPGRPNIILLESDDHHYLALGCRGDPVKTPNIDRLAARGVLFRNNVCQGTACSPSRNSLLTGSYPHNTGVFHNRDGNMIGDVWTFPAALQRAGYTTALIGKNHFKPPTAYTGRPRLKPYTLTQEETRALGFDHLHSIGGKVTTATSKDETVSDPYRAYLQERGLLAKLAEDYAKNRSGGRANAPSASVLAEADYQDSYIARQAAAWIRGQQKAKPFFMWVDFVAPHPPADPPVPYAGMYDWRAMRTPLPRADPDKPLKGPMRGATDETFQRFRAEYYAMITCLDAQIGKIIKALEESGQFDNTVIVFTGDQGSMLGDLGLWGKGVFYKGSINSPLVIAGPPSFVQGAKVDRPVELLDLAPTFLELAGAAATDRQHCRGHSLVPLLTGKGDYTRTHAFAEEVDTQMVVDERYKFVRDPQQPLLFDLAEDPDELRNLEGTLPEVERRLGKVIDEWMASTQPVRKPNPVPGKNSPDNPCKGDVQAAWLPSTILTSATQKRS